MNLFDGKSKNNDVMCGISFKTIYCLKSQRAKAEVLVFGNINNDLDSFKFSRCAFLFHYFFFFSSDILPGLMTMPLEFMKKSLKVV